MSDDPINPAPLEAHDAIAHNQAPPPNPAGRREDQKFCFSCGTVMHVSAQACPQCGATQSRALTATPGAPGQALSAIASANTAFCRGCGQTIHATAPLCPHCGAPQRVTNPYGQPYGPSYGHPKSRVTAALLAFFLGGLGVHKLYLGDVGLAVLYFLFCWTFIPTIIALIEGVIYVTMSDEDFALKYNRR
jgi:TM2 domain-containing membrane protein YozV/RNA polymerase subunit RPABC4/transcription elongation factor Spt4